MKNNVQSVEFEGADVEEAVRKALEHFNVSREELSIKIVCEEKKGLFGMQGAKLAKIKVHLKKNKV